MWLNLRGFLAKVKQTTDLEHFNSQLPGNFYWKDLQGKYIRCSQGMLNLLKIKLEDLIGKTDRELWPACAETLKIHDEHIISNGYSFTFEEVIHGNTSDPMVFLVTKMPWQDNNRNIIGIIGNLTDITPQKQREIALQKEKGSISLRFENVVDASPGNLYWKDKEGVYLGCNNFMVKISHLKTKADIIGKTDRELWPEHADLIRKNDLQVLETGKTIVVEEFVNERTYLSNKVPLRDESNEVIGVIGISTDITYLKEIEAELRKTKEMAEVANRAKTEFLENMRHDIRTPLTGIIGFSSFLEGEADSERIKEYAEKLKESSNALLQFLNEILESINVATGEVPLLKKRFDLETTLNNVIQLHQPKAMEKKLKLELLYDERIPNNLIGDPVRIYRIVLELLVNALKFTKEGKVTVTAKLAKKENRDVVVQIEVEDTGPGVPPEKQQDLYVRFKRLTPSYQGIYKGAGLGLFIIKQFIDDLQGEIEVISEPNQGATFVCLIPLTESLVYNPVEVGKINYKKKTNIKSSDDVSITKQMLICYKLSVLVVEDQPIAADVTKKILSDLGCDVTIAEDGEKAIKLANDNRYDTIIMDIGLPDLDGFSVTKCILASKGLNDNLPIVVGLTGHIDSKKEQLGIKSGMEMMLAKPLTEEVTIDILHKLIKSDLLRGKKEINNNI